MSTKYLNHDLLSRLATSRWRLARAWRGTCPDATGAPTAALPWSLRNTASTWRATTPRRLDWKAYARSDRYYIKEFEADTNLRAYIGHGPFRLHELPPGTGGVQIHARMQAGRQPGLHRHPAGGCRGTELFPAGEGQRRAAHSRLPPSRPPERAHQPDGHALSPRGDRPGGDAARTGGAREPPRPDPDFLRPVHGYGRT